MHRFTAAIVREPIKKNIEEFRAAIAEMFQKTAVFLHSSKIIDIYGAPTIVADHTIVDAANHLIETSEPITKYLNFIKAKTGFNSGGDPSLESEITAAREWANILLNAFKALKKVERSAGGLQGLKPTHCVSVNDGIVMYRKLSGEWAQASIEHPVLRTPGTQWHKWFTFSPQATEDRCQIPNHPRTYFSVLLPRTSDFIKRHIVTQFRRFDTAFNVVSAPVSIWFHS